MRRRRRVHGGDAAGHRRCEDEADAQARARRARLGPAAPAPTAAAAAPSAAAAPEPGRRRRWSSRASALSPTSALWAAAKALPGARGRRRRARRRRPRARDAPLDAHPQAALIRGGGVARVFFGSHALPRRARAFVARADGTEEILSMRKAIGTLFPSAKDAKLPAGSAPSARARTAAVAPPVVATGARHGGGARGGGRCSGGASGGGAAAAGAAAVARKADCVVELRGLAKLELSAEGKAKHAEVRAAAGSTARSRPLISSSSSGARAVCGRGVRGARAPPRRRGAAVRAAVQTALRGDEEERYWRDIATAAGSQGQRARERGSRARARRRAPLGVSGGATMLRTPARARACSRPPVGSLARCAWGLAGGGGRRGAAGPVRSSARRAARRERAHARGLTFEGVLDDDRVTVLEHLLYWHAESSCSPPSVNTAVGWPEAGDTWRYRAIWRGRASGARAHRVPSSPGSLIRPIARSPRSPAI